MIGVFDSGVGGLTVVKELLRQLPSYDFTYFGDTARTPYGTKSKEVITRYALEDAEILLNKGAKVIIVACNSASASACKELKSAFPNIPIFEVISPAVKKALQVTKNNKLGLIGTRATVSSGIYERLLKKEEKSVKVFSQACPLLVPLIEEGWLDKAETKKIIKKYLHPLRLKNIDALILGCTHYPLLKNDIQIKIGRRVSLVDSAEEVVDSFKKFLQENKNINDILSKGGKSSFFASDISNSLIKNSQRWLGKEIDWHKVEVG